MKRIGLGWRFCILVLSLSISAGLCRAEEAGVPTKIKVAATIFPLADIVRQVGQDRVEVITILPAGANPHTFQVTPKQVLELAEAKALFRIGHHLDDWVSQIALSAAQVKMVSVDHLISPTSGGEIGPHYWLSLKNAKIMAKNSARELGAIDPESGQWYELGAAKYIKQLDQADREIRSLFSLLPRKKIVTFHPAWSYFASDYGLEIVGTVEPGEGSEPTPKSLAALSKAVRQNNVRALFVEPWIPDSEVETFLQDLNLKSYKLDPIGGAGEYNSYINMMRRNARTMVEALKNG